MTDPRMSTVLAAGCQCDVSFAGESCPKCGRGIVLSVADLARVANQEHAQVRRAATAFVLHAIRAGDALKTARAQVARGGWEQWVQANFHGSCATAAIYMRFHTHRTSLAGVSSYADAARIVREIDGSVDGARNRRRGEDTRRRAREMRDAGASYASIAASLGVSSRSVYTYCHPEQPLRLKPSEESARARRLGRLAGRIGKLLRAAEIAYGAVPLEEAAAAQEVLRNLRDSQKLAQGIADASAA